MGSDSYKARVRAVLDQQIDAEIIVIGSQSLEGTSSYSKLLSKGGNPDEAYESFKAEHPLFILYANSATGIPRGSVFASGGFLVQSTASFDLIFNSVGKKDRERNLVCCINLASSAGQSYGLWGAFLNGCRIIISSDGENPSVEFLRLILKQESCPMLLIPPRVLAVLQRELDGKPLLEDSAFPLIACCGDVFDPTACKVCRRIAGNRS